MRERGGPNGERHAFTQEQYALLFPHLRRGDDLEVLRGEHGFAGPILDQALLEGDTIEGFVVRMQQPLLSSLVRRIGRPQTLMDWEDLLQESRLRLVEALRFLRREELRPGGNVEGYLTQAMVNRLRDVRQHARRQRAMVGVSLGAREEEGIGGAEEWNGSEDPCALLERHALWEELQRMVGTNGLQLLWNEHVAEVPQAESATALRVTTRTVRNRLDRARRQVRSDRQFCQDYE